MTTTPKTRTLDDVREALFDTIDKLKSGAIDVEQAKAIDGLAKNLIDSAKVEVDYLRVTGGGESSFIESAVGADNLPAGVTGRTVHRLK